jgi:hypothetical protein
LLAGGWLSFYITRHSIQSTKAKILRLVFCSSLPVTLDEKKLPSEKLTHKLGQDPLVCTMRYLTARGNVLDGHLPKIIHFRRFPWQPTLPFAKKQ